MATEKKSESKDETSKMKFKAKLAVFLKKNLVSVILFAALILVSIWYTVRINVNLNHFENEKIQLITRYETERDSLYVKHMEFASTVFSWSIRSELLRNNIENLNQLLTVFVKESEADLVLIINPVDNMVLLSSDKKFEGLPYSGNINFELKNPIVIKEDNIVRIITPVMGFSSMIGVLIVETREIIK